MASFQEDTQAQFAALIMAVSVALKRLADQSGNDKKFLESALETGLHEIGRINFSSIPDANKEAFLENARARYSTLIVGIQAGA
jgi:hypothetical protein